MKFIFTIFMLTVIPFAVFTQTPYKSHYSNSGKPAVYGDSETYNGRNGNFKIYSEDGRFIKELNYINGDKHGPIKITLDNNKVLEGKFEDNLKTDMWTTFYASGEKSSQGSYLEGNKIGTWRFYHPNGQLARKVLFRNNEVSGSWTFYNNKGVEIKPSKNDINEAELIAFAIDKIWDPQMQMSNYDFFEKSKQIDFVKNTSHIDKAIKVEYLNPSKIKLFETDSIHSLVIPFFVPSKGEFNILFEYAYKIESWYVFTIDGIGVADNYNIFKINDDKFSPFIKRLKSSEKAFVPYAYIVFNSNGQLQADNMRGKLCFLNIDVKAENVETFKKYYLQLAYNMFSLNNGAQEMFDYNYYLSYLSENIQDNFGISKSYYDNGTLEAEITYSVGVAHGPAKLYNEDGTLQGSGAYYNRYKHGVWKHYYKGQLSSEYTWENGEKQGVYKEYHHNTKILEETGSYVNDLKEGTWKSFYTNGALYTDKEYVNGELHGSYKVYHKNGKEDYTLMYENGKAEGKVTSYYDNGSVNYKATYVNGDKQGEFIQYYKNGNLSSKGNIENGYRYGLWEHFYDNGVIQLSGSYDTICKADEDKYISFYYPIRKGEWKGFNPKGELIGQAIYKDCGVVARSASFNDSLKRIYIDIANTNDSVISSITIDCDNYPKELSISNLKYESITLEHNNFTPSFGEYSTNYIRENTNFSLVKSTYFNEDKVLLSKLFYKNGLADSVWASYYENKQTKDSVYFVQGKLEGEGIRYYETGQIRQKALFFNGHLHGTLMSYAENGKLTSSIEFKVGKREGKTIYYYENGNESLVIEYANDTKNGTEKHYSYNGKLISERHYLNNVPVNTWINYYENGNIKSTGEFLNGLRNGEWLVYSDTGRKQQVLTWENGLLLKVKTYKGSYKLVEGSFKKGTGTVNHYKRNGSLDSSTTFINGKFKDGNEYWSIGNAGK